MRIKGGLTDEQVVNLERKKITIFNSLFPLIMLLLSAGLLVLFIGQEITLRTKDVATSFTNFMSVADCIDSDTADHYLAPLYYITYFDENGERIEDKHIGSSKKELSRKFEAIKQNKSVEIDGQSYTCLTRKYTISNDIGAVNIVVYYNIEQESVIFTNTIYISFTIIAIFFGLQLIFSALLASYQVKPYDKQLERNKQLVSDISHEFNTPLAVVQSNISNILTTPNSTVEEVSDKLVSSMDELNRLKKMVKDMLQLSRSERKSVALELENINLTAFLDDVAEPFVTIGEMANRHVETDLQPNVECIFDKNKLKQLVIILLDNAIKYVFPNDSVRLILRSDGEKITISVSDNGPGVAEEEVSKLFQRFYRADSSRSAGGTGLGLAIAKAIADECGCKILARSNKPHGLCFTFVMEGGYVVRKKKAKKPSKFARAKDNIAQIEQKDETKKTDNNAPKN
ncbi:MAG: HAMP domain-containing sensor histidine kinase [Clostridia bacterium]